MIAITAWLAAALASQAAEGGAKGAGKPESTPPQMAWYAQATADTEGGFLVTYFWSVGTRFRALTVYDGHPIVTIVNGPSYYTLDLLLGTGLEIERSAEAQAADAGRGRPFGDELESLSRTGGEKVGESRAGGVVCDLYRRSNSASRVEVCVSRTDPPLPIRLETYERGSGKTQVVNYVDWRTGLQIPDAFFLPASNIAIERVSYQEYRRRSLLETLGPAPPLFSHLLHGEPE